GHARRDGGAGRRPRGDAAGGAVDGRAPMKASDGRTVGRSDGWFALVALLSVSPTVRLSAQDTVRLRETEQVLAPLIEAYRDSGPARRTPPPLRVSVGTTTRAATQALGVTVGSTITMPKRFVRLAGTRATGRSMDDRVGSAAQILAVRHLDQSNLKHQVIFIWSTREEIGLEGAAAVAGALGTAPRRVHAIDTFVSADSPLELQNFAVAPIGAGAVARALDNSSVTPPAYVDSLFRLARARGVALPLGTTNGGNDGSLFTPYGV